MNHKLMNDINVHNMQYNKEGLFKVLTGQLGQVGGSGGGGIVGV